MTENYAGDFPFWLAPEQIRLLPVTDEVLGYVEELQSQLKAAGVRASIDRSGDRLGKLIRTGEQMKIPVLAVIGAKEADQGAASLRSRRDGDLHRHKALGGGDEQGLRSADQVVGRRRAAPHPGEPRPLPRARARERRALQEPRAGRLLGDDCRPPEGRRGVAGLQLLR